jgi:hypothetical protein
MKSIWKFELTFSGDIQEVSMPKDAVVLPFFAVRDGTPTFWAEIDTEKPISLRYFRIYGTGHKIDKNDRYIKSCEHGLFIWHLFEHSK